MRDDAEIETLVRAFEDCTFPHARWKHTEHLTVALWYQRRHPRNQATELIRTGIQRYNARYGRADGYHETVTLAWIALIDRFLRDRDRGQSLSALTEELLGAYGGGLSE